VATIEKPKVGLLVQVSRPANWAILVDGTVVLSGHFDKALQMLSQYTLPAAKAAEA
jgi:hypothetical protein